MSRGKSNILFAVLAVSCATLLAQDDKQTAMEKVFQRLTVETTEAAQALARVVSGSQLEKQSRQTFATWRKEWAFPAATPGRAIIEFTVRDLNGSFVRDVHICFSPEIEFPGTGVNLAATGAVPGKVPPDAPTNSQLVYLVLGGWGNDASVVRQGVSVQTELQKFKGAELPSVKGKAVDIRLEIDQPAQKIVAYARGEGAAASAYRQVFSYDGGGKLPATPWKYFSFSAWDNTLQYTNIRVTAYAADAAMPANFFTGDWDNKFREWPEGWVLPEAGKGIITADVQMSGNVHVGFIPNRYRRSFVGDAIKVLPDECMRFIGWTGDDRSISQLLIGGSTLQNKNVKFKPSDANAKMTFIVDKASKQFIVMVNNWIFMQQEYPAWIKNIAYFSATSAARTPVALSNVSINNFDVLSPAEMGKYSLSSPVWQLPSAGDGTVSFSTIGANDITCLVGPYEIVLYGERAGAEDPCGHRSVIRKGIRGKPLIDAVAQDHPAPGKRIDVSITINKALKKISVAVNGKPLMQATDPEFDATARDFTFTSWNTPVAYSNIRATNREVDPEEIAQQKAAVAQQQAEAERLIKEAADKKQKELDALKAHADAVVDAGKFPSFTWKEAWKLPEQAAGVVRFQALASSDILMGVSEDINTGKPNYELVLFGNGGTRCELRNLAGSTDKPVVLAGVDKAHPSVDKMIDVMVSFNRAAKRIEAFVNGEKILEYVDPKYNMKNWYIGFSASTTQVIYNQVTLSAIDALENFPVNFTSEGEFSSRVTVGLRDGKVEAWCIDEEQDASLKRLDMASTAKNPWVAMEVKDGSGATIADIQDISVSSDGVMCLLDGSGKAYMYNWGTKSFEKMQHGADNDAVGLEFISVGNKDAIYAVDVDTNTLYRYASTGWQASTAIKASYVSAAQDGTAVVIMPQGSAFIRKEGKGGWQEIGGETVRRVAAVSKDVVYAIDHAGCLLEMINGGWSAIVGANGKAAGIASELAANVGNMLLVTDSEMDIYSRGLATSFEDADEIAKVAADKAAADKEAADRASSQQVAASKDVQEKQGDANQQTTTADQPVAEKQSAAATTTDEKATSNEPAAASDKAAATAQASAQAAVAGSKDGEKSANSTKGSAAKQAKKSSKKKAHKKSNRLVARKQVRGKSTTKLALDKKAIKKGVRSSRPKKARSGAQRTRRVRGRGATSAQRRASLRRRAAGKQARGLSEGVARHAVSSRKAGAKKSVAAKEASVKTAVTKAAVNQTPADKPAIPASAASAVGSSTPTTSATT